ncbi:MAG: LemA family protein [Candidatus Omnitrophica bacterium]|nr:LemA family protein [Candidatus Omnitrophota bacterium]
MVNRMSANLKRLFPKDLEELKPVKIHWWSKIDFSNLQKKEGQWMIIAALIIILPGIYYYNKFIGLSRFTEMEQHQIEVQLQRRRNLSVNLAKMVLAYAEHERVMYEYMADKRAATLQKTDTLLDSLKKSGLGDLSKIKPSDMEGALSKFMALAEAYPDLKLSTNFQDLMNALVISENRIADSRMEYNKAASLFHAAVREIPACVYAFIFGYHEKQFHYASVDKDLDKPNLIDYEVPKTPNEVPAQIDLLKVGTEAPKIPYVVK